MSPMVGRGPGPQWDGARAARGTRGRSLRGLLRLVQALPPAGVRDARRARRRHRGDARAAPARQGRDRRRHRKGRLQSARSSSSSPFLVSALLVWLMTYLQTYLVGWVGQRALADLRLQIFEHLQSLPIGFYESRPAGVLISRMTNDVEALDSLVTDSVVTLFQSGLTLIGTIGILHLPRPQARAAHVPGAAAAAGRLAVVPDRLGRRVPPHPRDDRRDHRRSAGEPLGRAGRAQLRPGARPRRPLHRAERRQPGRQHA